MIRSKHSLARRASQIALAAALGGFTAAAAADPFTLQATCRLTSIIAGQGVCQMEVSITDSFITPTVVHLGLLKIDGVVVAQYSNDIANPAQTLTTAGSTYVACGATHTILAYVAPNPGTTYERVGSLQPIKCPTAP